MNKYLAGIIIYNPEQNLFKLVDFLIEQKVDVFLFINKSNLISDEIIKNKKIKFYEIGTNVGVSEGLNFFIEKFLESNYDFLFTFDQDSMISRNFVKDIVNVFLRARNIDKNIICCSPIVLDVKFKKNKNVNNISENSRDFQYIDFAITSGSLFIKESFHKVGLMNKLLFIDGVDTDWCERANLLRYRIIKANNVFLNHKIGSKYINFFGIKKSYHDQNLRVYYIMRNSIFLLIYGENTFRWKSSELLRTIIRLVAYPCLSSTKLKTLLFIFFAFKDALLKKMGKMNYIEH